MNSGEHGLKTITGIHSRLFAVLLSPDYRIKFDSTIQSVFSEQCLYQCPSVVALLLIFGKNQKNQILENLAAVFASYCMSVMSPGHKIGLPEYGLPTFVRKIDERPFWISALIFWMKNNRARG